MSSGLAMWLAAATFFSAVVKPDSVSPFDMNVSSCGMSGFRPLTLKYLLSG
jgi:hypothetical protein